MDATEHPRSRLIARRSATGALHAACLILIPIVLGACADRLERDDTGATLAVFEERDPYEAPPPKPRQLRTSITPDTLSDAVSQQWREKKGVGAGMPERRNSSEGGIAFPTGDPDTSQVYLQQLAPITAHRDRPFSLVYLVTNLTDTSLDRVRVHLHRLENLTLIDSSVHPGADGETVYFDLGRLGPAQSRTLTLSARSIDLGPASATATVTYRNALRTQTNIVEPRLRIEKSAPKLAARDDVFELTYTLTNEGTGTATGVTIVEDFPGGLTTIDDRSAVSLPVAAIGPGQTETRTVRVRASTLGVLDSRATVTADHGITLRSEATTTTVLDPSITVWLERDPAEPASVSVVVRNTGPVAVSGVRVTVPVAQGDVAQAPPLALVLPGRVVLGIERLAPGERSDLRLTLSGAPQGPLRVTASAQHVAPVSASLTGPERVLVANAPGGP
ncbi:MAG: hypothetical protein ACF8Q5_02770 [Phycisphaerales bacterium JB040]